MVMEGCNATETYTEGDFYIICLTLDGLPLFSRSNGNIPSLPFPVVGSLNGVHMFSKNNNIKMGITIAENAKIIWKEILSIKLIIVYFDINCTEDYLKNLLENIYKCMVMVVGKNEFLKISNIEKLKKKLRLCLPFIMNLLTTKSLLIGNLTQQTDIILYPDISLIQNCLDNFADECQSEFGALTLYGKVITGTEKFWQLVPIETCLMLYLIETMPVLTASDMAIYLPHGSPTVPHRLVVVNLIENVNVLIVCGPEPSLDEILHKYINKHWLPFLPVLKSATRLYPRCFSSEIKLDQNLTGFILENKREDKCLSSFYPYGNMTACDQTYLSNIENRKYALFKFYKSIDGTLFKKVNSETRDGNEPEPCKDLLHESTESYICTKDYKCYALQTTTHDLFALYGNDIPTYAMSGVTKQTLKQLTKSHII